MRIFNPMLAEKVVTFTSPGEQMRLVFCSPECKIDWRNGKMCYPSIAHRNMYGCWQCGEDLLQGMNLAGKETSDNNIYRVSRTGKL